MTESPPNSRPLEGPPPQLKAPPGTVDCHIHVFPDGFESQPGGPPIRELATLQDYAVVQRRLGLDRVVVTQPNAYQFDNRATLSAVAQLGQDKARAVVAVAPDTPLRDLQEMHQQGARGARIMDLAGGAATMADLGRIEPLAREVGWHLMVQFDGREIDRHLPALRAIETDYIIDHSGKFMEPVPADDRRVDEILRLLDRGNAWFKLCGCYETSRSGAPEFADVGAIAKRAIAHAPERIVWGSNWPHVWATPETYPDDAQLLDVLLHWTTAEMRQKILVDNPARLYGF